MIKNIKWLFLVSLTFIACNDDEIVTYDSADALPLTAGTADFSKYVALGNSLTSGYSDGALFIEGQKGAYPNILAQQFALVGGGEFKIPFMNDNLGGLLFGGATNPKFGTRLYFDGAGPVSVSGTPSTEVFAPHSGSYNNMGVPGAKSYHLLFDGYGNPSNLSLGLANPYFVRFATAPNKSILQDAMAQLPTFFSLWIGNNDVLGYATAGGVTTAQDPEFGGDITPPAGVPGIGFEGTYTAIINTLTSAGSKGVIANIPYVNSIPFFTTVPYNPLVLPQSSVDALNTAYAQYNGGLAIALANLLITAEEKAARTIVFKVIDNDGKPFSNPVVIVDEYLSTINLGGGVILPNYRQATKADFLVLKSKTDSLNQAFFLAGNGSAIALADRFVLSKNEVVELTNTTDTYNATIKSLATSKGLAFVDANAIMTKIAIEGVTANGFTLNSTYVSGGAFSLDGVHPSPRGAALIANEFIKAINLKYGSNLKGVNIGDYRILFPRDAANF
jgi:hypothetical protein